jgi:hypothetical protein
VITRSGFSRPARRISASCCVKWVFMFPYMAASLRLRIADFGLRIRVGRLFQSAIYNPKSAI